MHSSLALALLLLAAAPGDCGGRTDSSPTSASEPVAPPPQQQQEQLTRLFSQQHSGWRMPIELVVRDRATWETTWRTLHGEEGTTTPVPAVDFDRQVVVLVGLGELNTGGHTVRIDGVTPSGDGGTVRYTVVRPGPGCMTTQALTAPVDVVQAPKVGAAVRFERTLVRQEC